MMRKAFLHEQVLLAPLAALLREARAVVHREYPVRVGGSVGFIDLFAERGEVRLACEAELTSQRAARDVRKAVAAGATRLLIVTPTRRVADRIVERIGTEHPGRPEISVLPLGRALGLVQDCFPLSSVAFRSPESNQKGLR